MRSSFTTRLVCKDHSLVYHPFLGCTLRPSFLLTLRREKWEVMSLAVIKVGVELITINCVTRSESYYFARGFTAVSWEISLSNY